jgi:hypothetical protein
MVLEPIPNVLMNLLHQLNTFLMRLVGDGYGHQSLDDGTEQVKKVNVVHREDGKPAGGLGWLQAR